MLAGFGVRCCLDLSAFCRVLVGFHRFLYGVIWTAQGLLWRTRKPTKSLEKEALKKEPITSHSRKGKAVTL